jgi:anti-anti-sigma factor
MPVHDEITIEMRNGYVWVTLPAVIVAENAKLLEGRIEAGLSRKNKRLVLDLRDVQDLYSAGIGLLVRLRKKAGALKGFLCLVNVSERFRELLESIHLDRIFLIYATDIEFKLSQDTIWREIVTDELGFVFVANAENQLYRFSMAGYMDALHDLSSLSEFHPAEKANAYIFDMQELDTIDSYGAQLFLEFIHKANQSGIRCIAYGANQLICELLHLLAPDAVLSHYATETQALAASATE